MNRKTSQLPNLLKPHRLIAGAILVLTSSLLTPALAVEPDKLAHFGGATALGLGIDTLTYHYATEMGPAKRIATSAGLAFIPGLGIEIGDEFSSSTYFSWSDLAADAAGAVFGAVAGELVNGQLWVSASGKQIRLIGRW